MKRIYKHCFVMMVMMFLMSFVPSVVVEAEEFKVSYTSGDITSNVTYSINEDGETVTLTDFSDTASNPIGIKIPETVTYGDKQYVITALGDYAFYVEDNLASVEIPKTVKSIEEKCFYTCKMLQTVTFKGDGLEFIGDRAFMSCNLQSFEIPSTVTTIEEGAFGYAKFKSITIPKSLTKCGRSLFFGCNSLKTVIFEEGLTVIPSEILESCPDLEKLVLPSTLKTISKNGLAVDGSIKELILPAGLEYIDSKAFYGTTIEKLIVKCDNVQLHKDALNSCDIKELHCSKQSVFYKLYVNDSYTKLVLTGIYLKDDAVKLDFGKTYQMTVMNPTGTTTWSTSDASIATVSDTGLVTGVGTGTAVITAVNNGITMQCSVTVGEFKLNKTQATVGAGATVTLKATEGVIVEWKSSNPKIATVNEKGVVTTKKKGKVKITATAVGTTLTCNVTVKTNERKNLEKYPKKASAYQKNIAGFGFSKIKRDSKGNYIISGHFLNNYSQSGTYLKNLRVNVYMNNKLIASQKFSKFKIKAPAHSMKPVTIKIKKNKIKKPTTDLRTGKVKIRVSGGTLYR